MCLLLFNVFLHSLPPLNTKISPNLLYMSSPSCHIIRSSSDIPTILSHCKVLYVPDSPTPIHPTSSGLDSHRYTTSVLSGHQLSHLHTVTSGLSPPWALSCHIITPRNCTSTFTYHFPYVPNLLSIQRLCLVMSLCYPSLVSYIL